MSPTRCQLRHSANSCAPLTKRHDLQLACQHSVAAALPASACLAACDQLGPPGTIDRVPRSPHNARGKRVGNSETSVKLFFQGRPRLIVSLTGGSRSHRGVYLESLRDCEQDFPAGTDCCPTRPKSNWSTCRLELRLTVQPYPGPSTFARFANWQPWWGSNPLSLGSEPRTSMLRTHGNSVRGAGERLRTPDPLLTKQLLFQLSYTGVWIGAPRKNQTSDLDVRSVALYPLSYGDVHWCLEQKSNLRRLVLQTSALPSELSRQGLWRRVRVSNPCLPRDRRALYSCANAACFGCEGGCRPHAPRLMSRLLYR